MTGKFLTQYLRASRRLSVLPTRTFTFTRPLVRARGTDA